MSVEPGGVPQKKIGAYWRYGFEGLVVKEQLLYFYGFSEGEARRAYKEYFGVEAGKLISREPW